MSRVHDALRRAGTSVGTSPLRGGDASAAAPVAEANPFQGLLEQVPDVTWDPAEEGHLIDAKTPHQAPTEEFRSLRTRLNHIQGLQALHTLVVTSPSPAEGKTFTAANLALAQSHLQQNLTLLCDFDFRRPSIHNLFKIGRSPGLTDYLQGKASLSEIIKHVVGTNLYVVPAGGAVLNPLELLNLREVKLLLEKLPALFNWVILDTPPLLFAADANLLSTIVDGTLLVVRLGQTTNDSVTRAIQSLSHNNVIGVAANGASRGELYSKYTYYHSYYYNDEDKPVAKADAEPPEEEESEE